ncbi:MAG: leucine--tRNA ligase [Clostridia bacterium]|nr:leucine--tRNA ligase [Clostridia bacterium]
MKEYNKSQVEEKWKRYWEENKTFKTDAWDFSKPKYYVLDMFPYPSGAGLHVGHPEGYTATDIIARMKRMQGYNVLHPMGYDSFGLSAEQYAVRSGNHPYSFTSKNITNFRGQLKNLGFSYDWDREISTCEPSFYKWTQWIFIKLFEKGLAKYQGMPVNWCEALGTVLANDEVIDGKSENGGFPVEQRILNQWIIDMPAYAQKLLDGLDGLDWPESTKKMQKNWIGKSEGVQVKVQTTAGVQFEIFTTCIETIYGITFFVLAPESDIVKNLMPHITNKAEVEEYIKQAMAKSDFERSEMNTGKTGVELKGVKAINPVNGKEVSIFAGDFVIASYGTGAVMAVPTHDQRDFEFAKAFNIPMIQVIDGADVSKQAFEKQDYLGKGCKLINSAEFSGLTVEEAKKKITDKLEKQGLAQRKVNFRIRDWIFARQRYWGEPVPVVHLEDGTIVALDEKDLPLELPFLEDYKGKNGNPPLENAKDWMNVTINGKKGKREASTMPGSAGSSWYFMRYIDPHNDKAFADKKLLEHWMPVDLYVGGPEHTTGHLLYSRMWTNFLHDIGCCPVSEPFQRLVHPGMILGENNIKMGKRFPEYVVDPNDVIREYSADVLRMYLMFMGALTDTKPWNKKNVEGPNRFLDKIWKLYNTISITDKPNKNLEKIYHQTVKKVTEDYENLSFNTAISQMMIYIGAVSKETELPREYAEGFVKMLSPVCPFMAEELWTEVLGHTGTITYEKWPTYDNAKTIEETVELPVQVCGKVRGTIIVSKDATQNEAVDLALANENINKFVNGTPKKVIYVPGRILNIIA